MNTKEKTPPDFSRERKRKELEKRRKNNQNLQVLNFSYIRGCGGDSCISPKSRSTHLKLRYKLNTECLMRFVRFFLSLFLTNFTVFMGGREQIPFSQPSINFNLTKLKPY